MRSRVVLPEKLAKDHEFLVAQMDEIDGLYTAAELDAAATGALIASLQRAWGAYKDFMVEHLAEEEEVVPALLRENFTVEEEAAVDALYCFWFATLRNNGVSHDGEHFSCAALKAVEDVGALARPPYGAVFRQNTLSKAERSLMALDFFEKTLADAGTGFLVADAPTVVDLGLFYILYELGEDDICPDWADKFGLPLLRAFADRVAARPQIAAFLASPARMPRYAREPSGASLYTYLAGRDSPDLSL